MKSFEQLICSHMLNLIHLLFFFFTFLFIIHKLNKGPLNMCGTQLFLMAMTLWQNKTKRIELSQCRGKITHVDVVQFY